MKPNDSRRQRLISLMQRKENLELRAMIQGLSERQSKIDEAQVQLRVAQSECDSAASMARTKLTRGAQIDVAIQDATSRSLVDRFRALADRSASITRLTEAVEALQNDIARRRERILKLEDAAQQAELDAVQVRAVSQSNEFDAIWLGARQSRSAI